MGNGGRKGRERDNLFVERWEKGLGFLSPSYCACVSCALGLVSRTVHFHEKPPECINFLIVSKRLFLDTTRAMVRRGM